MSIDLLFLLFIVFFAIVGYVRGFINQVISLLMILSVLFFAKPLADWIKYESGWRWISQSSELVIWGLSAFSILMVWMGIHGLVTLIKKNPGLSPADHWIGLAFGTLKGIVLVLILGVLYQTLPPDSRAQFADLDRDAKKSIFLSMSNGISSWDSIPSFQALGEARHRLEPTEIGYQILDRADDILPDKPVQKRSEHRAPWRASD